MKQIQCKYTSTSCFVVERFNLLSANPTKLSNALKQFFGKLPTNCLSVFDNFVGLILEGSMYLVAIVLMVIRTALLLNFVLKI